MAEKIIALVDGSIYSASVCEHAAWISNRTGASVELIHVLGRREAAERQDLSGSIRLGARSALLEQLAELDAQRSKLVARCGRAILEDAHAILEKAGVTTITTRLRHGDIVETVTEVEADARVIVIGKRGEATDFAKGHLGSNLERIVRTVHKPIFVASCAFRPIEKVLVAFDRGSSVMKAVEHIARSPLFTKLDIHIVAVGSETPETRKALNVTQAFLKSARYDAGLRIIAGRPEEVLSKLVESEGFDMVVMGAYGHSRIRSLIIGSTTTEMVRSCKVPIVLMR